MKAKIVLLGSSVFLILAGMMASYVLAGQAPGQPKPREAARPQAGPVQESPSSTEPQAVPPSTVVQGDKVSLNFSGADLIEVIHVLAQHLKLTYTVDPKVNGTVTIFSAEPIEKENLLPVFHKILRMNNAVAVKSGDLYRIAPIKEGIGIARPVKHAAEDSYALQVVPVRFFSVVELKKLLTPFVAPGGEILDYPRGNFLIIVDLPSNIKRLLEIKDLIDVNVFTGVRMEIYEPRISTAEELAEEMTKIMQAYASSAVQEEGFAAQFIPIPRINRLLVISHSEAAWTYVKRWVERIDVAAEGPGRRIFIYPVQNGKAAELADLLNEIYGVSGAVPRREAPPTLKELHGALPRDPRSLLPTPGSQGSSPAAQGPGAYAAAPAPAPAPPQARRLPPPAAVPPAPLAVAEEGIRIVADSATNSLVVFATAQEFQNIREVLKKLDLVPRQVLMDVLVAEITLTDDLEFGVQYAYQEGGLSNFASTVLPGPEFTNQGAIWGSSGLTAAITSGDNFRAVIKALMKDSKVKVLSNPAVLALDNRPARIQVGSEEPIATGTTTAQVGTPAQSTTIQYRNIGRILTIIPQVNAQGLVNLQVKVEVSEVGANVIIGQDTFASFDTRDAETTAVVQDGDSLVIGGIITDRKSRDRNGIPYLMDVPVLGRLFGVTTDKVERTELVILITPHVIRNREEGKVVSDKYIDSLASVKRELERLKRRREKERPVSKEPPLVTPDKESGMAPKEGSYVVPREMPKTPKSPIKGINFASRTNGETSQFGQESVEGVPETSTDLDEEPSAEEPEMGLGALWRGLLKILTFGLLGGEEEADAPKGISKVYGGVGKTYEGRGELKDKIISAEKMKRATPPKPARNANLTEKTAKSALTEREPLVAEGIVDPSQKVGKARPEKAELITKIKITPAQKAREAWVESGNGTGEAVWTVQVKAFSRESNARSLAKELQNIGYDAYVVAARVNGSLWYRVRIGHLADVEEAKTLHETLKMKERYSQAYLTSR